MREGNDEICHQLQCLCSFMILQHSCRCACALLAHLFKVPEAHDRGCWKAEGRTSMLSAHKLLVPVRFGQLTDPCPQSLKRVLLAGVSDNFSSTAPKCV